MLQHNQLMSRTAFSASSKDLLRVDGRDSRGASDKQGYSQGYSSVSL